MFSQYSELRAISSWDQFTSLGHPSKFQWFLRAGFVTALTSLNEGQPNFARCFSVSWAGTIYIHFWGFLPIKGILQDQNSLCVQVWRSPILAALLHGSQVLGVSQTLRRWAEGATYIRQGGHHIGHRTTLSFVIVMEAISREFRLALPWELLYADNLVVIAENEEDLTKRLNEWKDNVENRGMRVNMNKIKVMRQRCC